MYDRADREDRRLWPPSLGWILDRFKPKSAPALKEVNHLTGFSLGVLDAHSLSSGLLLPESPEDPLQAREEDEDEDEVVEWVVDSL